MEIWGQLPGAGAAGMDSGACGKLCSARGGCGGAAVWAGLITGPQKADPPFALSVRGCPAIRSADTNGLISQLISGSKQQSLLAVGGGGDKQCRG